MHICRHLTCSFTWRGAAERTDAGPWPCAKGPGPASEVERATLSGSRRRKAGDLDAARNCESRSDISAAAAPRGCSIGAFRGEANRQSWSNVRQDSDDVKLTD